MGDIASCGSITMRKSQCRAAVGPSRSLTTGTGLSGFNLSGGGEKLFAKLQPGVLGHRERAAERMVARRHRLHRSGSRTSASTSGSTANITLGFLGNAVCTYTNKRQPLLTLVKSVVNDNGGTAVAGAWTLGATGSSGSFSGTTNTAAVTSKTVTAGVQYTLAESGGPLRTARAAGCARAATFAGPDKITLGLGDDVTCTITDNDRPAALIVWKKVVVNGNGGTEVASEFSFQVNSGSARASRPTARTT